MKRVWSTIELGAGGIDLDDGGDGVGWEPEAAERGGLEAHGSEVDLLRTGLRDGLEVGHERVDGGEDLAADCLFGLGGEQDLQILLGAERDRVVEREGQGFGSGLLDGDVAREKGGLSGKACVVRSGGEDGAGGHGEAGVVRVRCGGGRGKG